MNIQWIDEPKQSKFKHRVQNFSSQDRMKQSSINCQETSEQPTRFGIHTQEPGDDTARLDGTKWLINNTKLLSYPKRSSRQLA